MSEYSCPQCARPVETGKPCPSCLLLLAAKPTDALDADLDAIASSADSSTHSPAVRPSAPPPDIEAVREAFPQLEILDRIGRGGMGTVFKARQPKLDRFVALKILSADLAVQKNPGRATFADRFAREGKLLARLNHPNIVAVYDFGYAENDESNGFYFLLMEYVDGVNLRQAMREERFTPEQAIAIVPKICDALQYAHDEGVLHRDIKPENILLDTRGRVKIADFGIAAVRAPAPDGLLASQPAPADQRLTQTGQILGTPSYMAPEQRDDPDAVDHRADIYSLGVVFYELLTGELPQGRFPVPSEKTPVGAAIDGIVLKALQKEREKRQQSAGELKTEIETATDTSARGPEREFVERSSPGNAPRKYQGAEFLVLLFVFGLWACAWSIVHVPILPEHSRVEEEKMFDRDWARAMIDQAVASLGDARETQALLPWLTRELAAEQRARLASELGMSETAIKVALHRLRKKFRRRLRERIAQTVASEAEIDSELAYLARALDS